MKSIKLFKYRNKEKFNLFLNAYGYKLDNVVGFSVVDKKQYHGNILKTYFIHFDDGEKEYFKVVIFRSINEYYQSKLGFNGNKLLEWYDDANVRLSK